jgi:hypothetical protein
MPAVPAELIRHLNRDRCVLFVGCVGEPTDPSAREIGVEMHRELLQGTPAAVALHRARLQALGQYEDRTGELYVISGYPEVTLA